MSNGPLVLHPKHLALAEGEGLRKILCPDLVFYYIGSDLMIF